MGSTFIIAEIGVNHNGDAALAARMARAAAAAGADAVKFHAYRTERIMRPDTPLAGYMTGRTGAADGFAAMARGFELSEESLRSLKRTVEEAGSEFLCSPFDAESVEVLAAMGVRRLKVPSGELVNPLLLDRVAGTGLPLIVSTGMSDLEEVRYAVDRLRQGRSGPVFLLHCVSEYPAPFARLNLRAMVTLRETFGLPVGFSDHSPGVEASVAAVALGACILEKHVTVDRSLPGPDQHASLTVEEFAGLVRAVRHVEQALGDGIKAPTEEERANRRVVRKSLVYRRDLASGTRLERDMLTAKRPGEGIPAREWESVCGRVLARDRKADEVLTYDDLR